MMYSLKSKLTFILCFFLFSLLFQANIVAQIAVKPPIQRSPVKQPTFAAEASNPDVFNLRNFGAVSDGKTDDTNALIAAMEAARVSKGGTIVFPAGVTLIARQVPLVNFIGNQGQLRLTGVGGRSAVLFGNTDESYYKFSVGNLDQLIIENLVFLGKNVEPGNPEFHAAALAVFYITYTEQVVIKDSAFYGLSVNGESPYGGIVSAYNSTLKVENTMFGGCAAPFSAAVSSVHWNGFEVRNTNFFDYGNYGGVYYSKSPVGIRAWVRATNANPQTNARPRSFLVVEDSSFDEASANAVLVDNARAVAVRRISSNNSAFGAAVNVKNVRNVKIEQSWFGYTPVESPGVIAENVNLLEIDNLEQANGVKYIWLKGTTDKAVIRYSELNNTDKYPNGVRNDANAIVERVD